MILILIFLLLINGCGKNSSSKSTSKSPLSLPTKQLKTVPEVVPFLSEMNEFMIVYLKKTAIDNLIVEYTSNDNGSLEGAARGYCDKSNSTPRIVLYVADWVGPYAADQTMKKAAFYHFVGH